MEELKLLPLDLSVLSEEVIEILLYCDKSTKTSFIDEIARKNIHRPKVLRYILNHPSSSEQTKDFVSQILRAYAHLIAKIKPKAVTKDKPSRHPLQQPKAQSLFQRVKSLKIGERIQLALRGGHEIRSILIRDPSTEVTLAVMENPKITDSEVELIAKQETTHRKLLRAIAQKKEWLRTYSIIHALIKNPKTPIEIALSHIHSLHYKDISLLKKNKNVPEAIRAIAQKLVKARSPL